MASILLGGVFILPGDTQGWVTTGMGFNALVEAQPLDPGASLTVSPLTASLDVTGTQLSFSYTVTNNSRLSTFYNLLGSWNM